MPRLFASENPISDSECPRLFDTLDRGRACTANDWVDAGSDALLEIYLCLGSSCYVRGSEQVAKALQALIARHGLQDQVDIVGTFCLEHCSMGVTLKVGEQVFEGVQPEAVETFFEREILPLVEGARRTS